MSRLKGAVGRGILTGEVFPLAEKCGETSCLTWGLWLREGRIQEE